MTDYQTKHEPVDDYPYICYAPEVDANTDEIGGGGGGGGGGYVLPVASASNLGGVKVGQSLEINASGVLNVKGGNVYVFTVTEDVQEQTLTINELSENVFNACQNGTVVIVGGVEEIQVALAIIASFSDGNSYFFSAVMPDASIQSFVGAAGDYPVYTPTV